MEVGMREVARNIDEIIYIVSEPLSSSPVSTPFSKRSLPFFPLSLLLFIISSSPPLSLFLSIPSKVSIHSSISPSFYPRSFLPILHAYTHLLFVSSFIEYICLCAPSELISSFPLSFSRGEESANPLEVVPLFRFQFSFL